MVVSFYKKKQLHHLLLLTYLAGAGFFSLSLHGVSCFQLHNPPVPSSLQTFRPLSSSSSSLYFDCGPRHHQLFMSTSNKPSSSPSSSTTNNNNKKTRVVYQKVVKSPKDDDGNSHPLFLGYLIEYVQERFELPSRLPMVYESVFSDNDTDDDNQAQAQEEEEGGSGGDKYVQSWDSPMSPSSQETRLDLEIVAIYTGSDDDDDNNDENSSSSSSSAPSMAMVVVKKDNSHLRHQTGGISGRMQITPLSPTMQNFFDESERLILKALDRGLDDFMAGKISMDDATNAAAANHQKHHHHHQQQQQQAIIEEMLEDAAENHPSVPKEENKKINKESEEEDGDIIGTETNHHHSHHHTQQHQKNMILDAEFSKVVEEEEEEIVLSSSSSKSSSTNKKESNKKMTTSSSKSQSKLETKTKTKTTTTTEADFAVTAAQAAAKKKRAQQKKQSSDDGGDFAVAAAKRIAKEQQHQQQNRIKRNVEKQPTTTTATTTSLDVAPTTKQKTVPTTTEGETDSSDSRAFRTTFSTPEMYAERRKQRLQSAKEGPKTKSKKKGLALKEPSTKGISIKSEKASAAPAPTSSSTRRIGRKEAKKKEPKRKLNLTVLDDSENLKGTPATRSKRSKKEDEDSQSGTTSSKDIKGKSSSKKAAVPSDAEIMQTAQDVMAELAEQSPDISAEELLQDVLKFGEKQDQENQVGSGFVSGAFEKAKELLREQKRKREERTRAKVAAQVAKDVASKMDDGSNSNGPQVKTRVITSEEEELRRMFEAGERIADGRISLATKEEEASGMTSNADALTEEQQKEVDELIAADSTVSDHARILDDELAELEVRIRQTPGEELDGPPVGKPFDIFSGPEVYNPNVDPQTAVNWPGALPGTKSIDESALPKELTEAVKQAKFAAEVLQKMQVKEAADSDYNTYFVGDRELSKRQVDNLQKVVKEAVEIGIIPDPLVLVQERSRLQMVLDELWEQPEERLREIVSNYKDLLLSDNFVAIVKERLETMAERDLEALRQRTHDDDKDLELEKTHARERELLGHLVVNAQLLLKEARALGAELEAQQIEVIRSICKVAMDPSHTTEEETAAALTDAVRDMRPLFDDIFVSYLKYAIAEEQGRLARAGVLDDPEEASWLFVLKIVQQGVHAEIAKGINRYIEHIWYVLRMKTAVERKMLLEKLVDDMPTLDVRPFVRVVDNIVGSLGEAARGEFDGAYELGKMTNKLLQLHRDMKEILPPERIDEMSRDADAWAAKRKERLLEQRRLTKQRLRAARETEEYDDQVEQIGRRGEMERFDG